MSLRGSSHRGSGRGQGGSGRGHGGGRGSGRGQGKGRSMGGGRGMNRDRGNSQSIWPGTEQKKNMEKYPGTIRPQNFKPNFEQTGQEELRPGRPNQEIEMLRAEANAITAQLQIINERISELKRGKPTASPDVTNVKVSEKISKDVIVGETVAVVDKDNCISCEICASVCPVGAITVEETAVINPQKCTGCGSCIDVCPNNAISFVELKIKETVS